MREITTRQRRRKYVGPTDKKRSESWSLSGSESKEAVDYDPDGILHAFDTRWGLTDEQIEEEYALQRCTNNGAIVLMIFLMILLGLIGIFMG